MYLAGMEALSSHAILDLANELVKEVEEGLRDLTELARAALRHRAQELGVG